MMRRLIRTTDGSFVRDGDATYALGHIGNADLVAAVQSAKLTKQAPITGELLAPVAPTQLVLVGINYASHAAEVGMAIPDEPILGLSSGDAVVAQGATVAPPSDSPKFLDFEGEIAVVIGKACHKISESEAAAHVFGVTACIDLSLRDVLFKAIMAMRSGKDGPSLASAKTFPGAKPLGPELLLTDGADLTTLDLALTTHVNGKQRQLANARDMIFSIPRLVAAASALVPLEPGDVISTGTPAGIGMSVGLFLEPGDVVSVTLGSLDPLTVTIA
jgi:2-keto-4-pentenoate hydratase/2-oxohepta-3-ene-1,7-dioic acid hydratase in catechol pathway